MLLSFDNMKQFIYDPGMFFIPLFRSIKNYNCMPARYILIIYGKSDPYKMLHCHQILEVPTL